MNQPRHLVWLAAVFSLAAALSPTSAFAGFKCWTNSEGVKECGQSIPPEYAQQETEQTNDSGMKITKARAKTAEEAAAAAAELERIEKQKAEEERLASERAARDRVLLATFTTEEDLLLARDGKLAAIDSRVQLTSQIVKKLEVSLEVLQAKAAKQELAGKAVSDKLKKDISKVQKRITKNLGFIDLRHEESEELLATFAADLKRYRELKGIY